MSPQILWRPKIWGLQQDIAEEEDKIRRLQSPQYDPPQIDEEEPPEEKPPIGWPWEWGGVLFGELGEKPPFPIGEKVPKGWQPPEVPKSWGERIKEHRELPLPEQLAKEAPFWLATMALPGATALRATLATKAGIPAKVAGAALKPIAAVEQFPGKAIGKVVEKFKKPPATKPPVVSELFKELPVGVTQPISTSRQRILGHNIAISKGWARPDGKMKPQYRRLAEMTTGKKSMTQMTEREADTFILALEGLVKRGIKPAKVPKITALMPKELADKLPFLKETGFIERGRQMPQVLNKIGLFDEIWRPTQLAEVLSFEELQAFRQGLGALSKTLGKDPARKIRIFEALENPLQTHKLDKAEQEAYKWFKKFFDDWADRLKLPASQRREHYVTHTFERAIMQDMKAKHPLDPELIRAMDFQFAKKTFNPYLQQRLGAKIGLKQDPFAAAEAYEQYALREYYFQPLVKKIAAFEPLVTQYAGPNAGRQMRAFANRMAGRPDAIDREINYTIGEFAAKFAKLPGGDKLVALTQVKGGNIGGLIAYNYASILYQMFLGLRPTSAIRNLSQNFLAVCDVGALNFSKGLRLQFTSEGRNALKQSLVLRMRQQAFIPGVDQAALGKLVGRTQQVSLAMFKGADKVNVRNSFMAGYAKGKALGLPTEWCIKLGDEVAMNTQYLYTKMARSMFEEGTLGRFLTPFTSWPRNWLELQAKWITARPSMVLRQYTQATGKTIAMTENPILKRKELINFLILVTAAYGVEKTTNLKATEYTGWTSIRSLGQFAGGDLPSLEIVGGLAQTVAGALGNDERMMKEGWNRIRPDKMIGIIRQLTNIAQGKSDWLSLFLYLNKKKKGAGNPPSGIPPAAAPTGGYTPPQIE